MWRTTKDAHLANTDLSSDIYKHTTEKMYTVTKYI